MEAKTLQIITNELYKYGKLIKEDEVKEVVELCQKANRIFIAGAGRSGFCARGFANRMMHLGLRFILLEKQQHLLFRKEIC